MSVRDRIVELVRVRAGDLVANPSNWRRHPEGQRQALQDLLAEVGYADALLARRDRGKLVLLDGHLRKSLDDDQIVPVLVLDVTAKEADTILATLDPLAALAQPDPAALAALLARVDSSRKALGQMLDDLRNQAGRAGVADPRADQIPAEAPKRVAAGDLWALGEHRLICGDSTDPGVIEALLGGGGGLAKHHGH